MQYYAIQTQWTENGACRMEVFLFFAPESFQKHTSKSNNYYKRLSALVSLTLSRAARILYKELFMSSFSSNFIRTSSNKPYKDRLFKAIFGRDNEKSKRWRLDLYNALNDSNYTDPDALELNTIENVIYIKMYNNVSFLIDS